MTKGHCHILLLSSLLMVSVSFQACRPDLITEQSKSIPVKAWGLQDTIGFPFSIPDTNASYDFYISLRHTTDYSYRNLFLFMDTYFPQGMITRDTLEFILAKPDGTWLGKGFSKIKYNRYLIRKGVSFPEEGDYRFVFHHAMRVETLPGLRDIGVRVVRSEFGPRP